MALFESIIRRSATDFEFTLTEFSKQSSTYDINYTNIHNFWWDSENYFLFQTCT